MCITTSGWLASLACVETLLLCILKSGVKVNILEQRVLGLQVGSGPHVQSSWTAADSCIV